MFCIFVLYSLCGTGCQKFICFLNRGGKDNRASHWSVLGPKNINVTQTFVHIYTLSTRRRYIPAFVSACPACPTQRTHFNNFDLIWYTVIRFIWTTVCLLALFQTFVFQLPQNFPFISSKYFVIVLSFLSLWHKNRTFILGQTRIKSNWFS